MVTVTVVLVVALVTAVAATPCPAKCSCQKSHEVTCEAAGLRELPRGVQSTTTALDLTENRLHELTSTGLSDLRQLVNLKLKHNEIEHIHDGAFQHMGSLQTLDLSANKLRLMHQETLRGAARLLHLDLSSNTLDQVDGAFADMRELSRLDLRNNLLRSITQFTFRDLASLRYLLLSGNLISHIDRKAFQNLEKLTYFSIKGNPIGHITRFEFNSYFLQYVDMSECGLQRIPRGLPNSIRYLQLRRNNITALHRNAFHECQYVSILVMDENGLRTVHERTFSHMTYLMQLWLNGNRLQALPRHLPASLQRLLMDHNQVRNLTDTFPRQSKLDEISLMGNNISYVSWDALHKTAQLTKLDISDNKVEQVFSNTFFNNTHLKTLLMSKNPFKHFHSRSFHGLSNLKTLNLAYVYKNTSIHRNAFRDLRKLKKLDLDSSPGIVREVFHKDRLINSLKSVEDLSVQSCELSSLRRDLPARLPRMRTLRLSSSRWHCDTSLLWLRDWLLTTEVKVHKREDIRCYTPQTVYGRPLVELQDSDFVRATTARTTTRRRKPSTRRPSTTSTTTTTTAPSDFHFGETPTPTVPAARSTSSQSEDSLELIDESPSSGVDLAPRDYEPDGSFDLPDEFIRELSNSGTRYPTWSEVLRKHPSYGVKDADKGSREEWEARGQGEYNPHRDRAAGTVLPPPPLTNRTYGVYKPVTEPPRAGGTASRKSSLTMLVLGCTLGGIVFILLTAAALVCICRRRRAGEPKEQYENAIKYQNDHKDVLYFMPNGKANGSPGTTQRAQHSPRKHENKRAPPPVANGHKGTNGHRGANGHRSSETSLNKASSREKMSLVPGRDIKHEGPMRVYKWEDF